MVLVTLALRAVRGAAREEGERGAEEGGCCSTASGGPPWPTSEEGPSTECTIEAGTSFTETSVDSAEEERFPSAVVDNAILHGLSDPFVGWIRGIAAATERGGN